MSKNKKIILLSLALVGAFFYYVFFFNGNILAFKNAKYDYFAKKITAICAKETNRPVCYDREIPKILKKGYVTMEGAFEVTSKIQGSDRVYLYCHILGHELSDIETQKDPSKWLDVITRCPTLACNNGCAHGAVMRRFKGSEVLSDSQLAELTPELGIACEPRGAWKPTELERSMCYHSIGHLGLYITDANIEKSLNLCKAVTIKNDGRSYYQTCVMGIFMLVFQSLDKDDEALVVKIKPTKEKVVDFCSKYSGLENVACRTESWPYFYDEFRKPEGLIKFCDFAEGEYFRQWCFDTGIRGSLTRDMLQTDGVESVANYCLALPSDMKARCFASVANSWVQDEPHYITDSIALCKAGEKYGFDEVCYNGLLFFSTFSFNTGTELWKGYCGNFPDKFKQKCLSGDIPKSW